MRFFSTLFWGIFLLSSGVILLLKHIFNLHWVSGSKLIFGLFVLLLGISLLTGNYGWGQINTGNDNVLMFSGDQHVAAENNKEYTVMFGSTDYDLTDLPPGSYVKINCIFGYCKVKLPPGAVNVNADCAFGNVRLPNGEVFFGSLPYNRDGDTKTRVEISCVFGGAAAVE